VAGKLAVEAGGGKLSKGRKLYGYLICNAAGGLLGDISLSSPWK
jgi:hypothetical protein